MRAARILLIMGTTAGVYSAPASAEIYKCTENGKTIYSGAPCGNSAVTVKTTPTAIPAYRQNEQARRDQYLAKNPNVKDVYKTAIKLGLVIPGMTEEQVLASKGEPARRNLSQSRSHSKWQWVYETYHGRMEFIYIEDGIVTGTN